MLIRSLYLPFSLSDLSFRENDRHPCLEAIQKRLYEEQVYSGPLTGCYDEETMEALARFQEKEGLTPTGQLNPLTLCRLQPGQEYSAALAQKSRKTDFALPRGNILITKSSRQLTLFDGNSPIRHYPVGIGKPATPTPVGNFAIAVKIMHPGGILGTRWLGLSLDSYGIHGTNKPWLIGQMVSLGCIRMKNPHVEELFTLVRVGTPVYIRD